MAKKVKKQSSSFSLQQFKLPFLLVMFSLSGWWLWETIPDIKDTLYQYVENNDILTLESNYTADELMDIYRPALIGESSKSFREPTLKYYPYLLVEVKYIDNKKSREGVMLWSMTDGEVVLNTSTWDTTHGFKDCLDCQATKHDFAILNALVKNQGSLSVDALQNELHLEQKVFQEWLADAISKHLVIKKDDLLKGEVVRLHFENPKLITIPSTRIEQNLVSKPASYTQRVAKNYSKRQLLKMAQAAFGPEFSVRSEKEVYLPVYNLEVQNLDGSIYTTEWNALTGQSKTPKQIKASATIAL